MTKNTDNILLDIEERLDSIIERQEQMLIVLKQIRGNTN